MPFVPTDIDGLELDALSTGTLYQDRQRTSPVTVDGDPVGSWTDASLNLNHLFSNGTNRPVYKTGVVNGLGAMLFDGTNDLMQLTAQLLLPSYSLYAVISVPDASDRTILNGGRAAVGVPIHSGLQWRISGDNEANETGIARIVQGSTAIGANTFTQVGLRLNTATLAASLRTARADDPPIATGIGNPVGMALRWIGAGGLTANAEFFKGYIAALLIYNGVHDSTQVSNVENYLLGIYGV